MVQQRNEAIVVTGAASGIGLAVTHHLLSQGWSVMALDRSEKGLSDLVEQTGSHRNALTTQALDLTDYQTAGQLARSLENEPVAGLVNSAGIGANIPFAETTPDTFRRMYEINVVAGFALSQVLVPLMVKRGGGSIVHIASVSGMRGNFGRSAYGASKGAMIALTQIMAVELASQGIRVNAVSPGPVETAMVREAHDELTRSRWTSTVPLHRYATPEEIAGAVGFLLDSSLSSYITGQNIAVDGGFAVGGLLP